MSTGAAADAQALLRCRLSDPRFSLSPSPSPDSNYSKLKFILSNSIFESCNNSVLLLGPRGCGKTTVLELVLRKLQTDHPDRLSVVRLNGLLHSDDRCALKEIVRQLCTDHQLIFSKMASCDDNSQFMLSMLRECALAHKAIIFVLDEFDLFTPGKQRLLYSLLDAMQSVQSQAVVVGVSCRLDADQLLEKRVRSRFSHRKLLFLPPSMEDLQRLLRQILFLPTDSSFRHSDFAVKFNAKLSVIFNGEGFIDILNSVVGVDNSVSHLLNFLFCAVCNMDSGSGFLSLGSFKSAMLSVQRQLKLESLQDVSILELYILVCMKRLEAKDCGSYNFNSIMKEYKGLQDASQTGAYYSRQAFEHLLECELVGFTDNNRGQSLSIEFRAVVLLISSHELYQGLRSSRNCPDILLQWFDRENPKSHAY
ncbi:origin of replication complex subunit 4 isoform X2 [Amborella trichopoda]|uniref:origin of replication complex subunit 4 isoform X2 n=1 Tax=Amborella trichopoda TaxID=13333 RepID=UPI0009C04CA2|nr:origin of replication complex subunit 4 isoform X2 [Amborella trichopoda]|eukprot:XP_020522688.1 origin of replication complex subunit 4 isoform X2 [Amborella trichopoda]